MTQKEFDNLRIGNMVRGKASGLIYVVVQVDMDCDGIVVSALGVRTQTLTRANEWDLSKPLPRSK